MEFFTFLGDEEFYLLVTPVLYWCIDTSLGIRTAMMLMFSSSVYTYGKWLFHTPRPAWISQRVTAYRADSSFGMPSGHSTNAVTIWGLLAESYRKKWFWGVAIGMMAMIGLSRIVLAVHFPHDVLTGWILGLVILFGFVKLEPKVLSWLAEWNIQTKMFIYFLTSLGLILIGVLVLLPLRGWSVPAEWGQFAAQAFPGEEPFNLTSLSREITLAGTFLGLAAGHTLLFSKNGYATEGKWWELSLRYLLGVVGVFVIWAGLDAIFPDGETLVGYIFRYLRYTLVGFWITFLGPKVFIGLKLAKSSQNSQPR